MDQNIVQCGVKFKIIQSIFRYNLCNVKRLVSTSTRGSILCLIIISASVKAKFIATSHTIVLGCRQGSNATGWFAFTGKYWTRSAINFASDFITSASKHFKNYINCYHHINLALEVIRPHSHNHKRECAGAKDFISSEHWCKTLDSCTLLLNFSTLKPTVGTMLAFCSCSGLKWLRSVDFPAVNLLK